MLKVHERAVKRKGFCHVYIQRGTGDETFVQGTGKVGFNCNAAAAGIYKNGRWFHLFKLLIAYESRRALIVRGVYGDNIGPFQKFREAHARIIFAVTGA